MRAIWLAILAACATPIEARYTATYPHVRPWLVIESAIEAAVKHGYAIAKTEKKPHWLAFLAAPVSVDESGAVQLGFVVHVMYERETWDGSEVWTVNVRPRAYRRGRELPDDSLPASAQVEASQLAAEIRAYVRSYEAPSL